MRISEAWLREWVSPAVGTQELADQLTMAGLEVDAIEPAAAEFNNVVVGEIVAANQHPDADKLQVCEVNVGEPDNLQIVCGAANARAGLRVVCAKVGAQLPGIKIKRAKLRGVESFGMLCSVAEIGFAEAADGIMELPLDAPIGADLREWLALDDQVIEVDLTPNRGDCLSMAGVAREVGTLNRVPATAPQIEEIPASIDTQHPIRIDAAADCPRYVGRVIKGLNRSAATPMWMQERLRRAGIRALGPLVDVTNYVLLELGQPMHAFDLAKLNGSIIVRRAQAAEKLTLIGGVEIELDDQCLVIADESRAIALAGVMGGEATAVDDDTVDILLESAFFQPTSIAGRARRFGLHTDSSHRFERGVDPELQQRAIERATGLLMEICGGEVGPVVDVSSDRDATDRTITLRRERIVGLLGMTLPDDEVEAILNGLGMNVSPVDSGWLVTPPSFRFDIAIEADLIEELARVWGYDRLPTSADRSRQRPAVVSESTLPMTQLRSLMTARGYREVITYSFVEPDLEQRLHPDMIPVTLANPISSEMAVMRGSLWSGLIQTARHNLNRQQSRIRIFESGQTFVQSADGSLRQAAQIGGLLLGPLLPEQWDAAKTAADFYDLKSDVESLIAISGKSARFEAASNPALHPGQTAQIVLDNKHLGWIGALHPEISAELGLGDQPVLLFQLELDLLLGSVLPSYAPIPRFPSSRRDIAVLVGDQVSSDDLLDTVRAVDAERIQDAFVFDVYRGEGVGEGLKSIALGLILQENSATLRDEDADGIMAAVVHSLQDQHGAEIRG